MTVTVAELFARYAHQGRAVLRGTRSDPEVWLTRPDQGRDVYCVCREGDEDSPRLDFVSFVPGRQRVRVWLAA